MFICVIRIYQPHIRRIMMHIFLKCLQPIWLQSTFNNTNRSPSQCRASGMEFLCLLEQGHVKERLKLLLMKCYGRYGDNIKQYEVSFSRMLNDSVA